jgi:hypothetical protein
MRSELNGSRAMMYPEDGPPEAFRETLEKLVPGVSMHVPDAILEIWFPPGPIAGIMDGSALATARAYGAKSGCGFFYLSDRHEGVFHKDQPQEVRTAGSLI